MELYLSDYTLNFPSNTKRSPHLLFSKTPNYFRRRRRRNRSCKTHISSSARVSAVVAAPEQSGGKMVVELVGAFNELTERMDTSVLSTSSSRLLFKTLKLCIPILQSLPLAPDGRSPISKALSVAVILADLQVKKIYLHSMFIALNLLI